MPFCFHKKKTNGLIKKKLVSIIEGSVKGVIG